MSTNLALDLTENELLELRRHTKETDDADARAAREFLRICRTRDLTSVGGRFDYEENAWRELDQAEDER